MKKYKLAACGGTFDHFHKGHKEFITYALEISDKLIIGITSEKFSDDKREEIENFSVRKASVISFLEKENVLERVEILPIDDIFGPTLLPNYPIEALIVSLQTQNGADIINNKRRGLKLPPLEVSVCLMSSAQDGKIISSSRIRNGEIDREGKLYINPLWFSQALTLPHSVRQKLKKPLGILLKDINQQLKDINPKKTITVGDVVTKTCNEYSFGQKISVIDFIVQREKKFSNILQLGFNGDEEILKITNPAGMLMPEVFLIAEKSFSGIDDKRYILKINGEEDLVVLPFVLASPLGYIILYGQPNEGVVKLQVSEEIKKRVFDIVSEFVL